ncbi:MAG: hypothetical protein V2A79_08035 [Planctomycetota bacterium]
MTIESLTTIYAARPFLPFTLQLADGTNVRVPHPEFMWMPPTTPRTIVVAVPNGAFKYIDPLLIAAVEVGDGKAGRRRRRT